MIINLWYNADMKQWRWTLMDSKHFDMHSGQREHFRDTINDIENTIGYMLSKES